jgi:hypothetical protein
MVADDTAIRRKDNIRFCIETRTIGEKTLLHSSVPNTGVEYELFSDARFCERLDPEVVCFTVAAVA